MAFDMNAEIATRIMGWELFGDGFYRDPSAPDGAMGKVPEFCLLIADHDLLLKKMKARGFHLTRTENPPDFEKNIGKTFTAVYQRQNEVVGEASADDDKLAVCLAALRAVGVKA